MKQTLKHKQISALSIAAVYIGTVVGAGFATGQEILQFFSAFGVCGLWGLVLSTLLFIFFGSRILRLGSRLGSTSHREIIRYAVGTRLGVLLDVLVTFFLFGSFASMIAGTGALFSQLYGLPEAAGGVLMAVLTMAAVWKGLTGVIASIRFVAPFLLLSVTVVSLSALSAHPPDFSYALPAAGGNPLISHWLLAAVLYVSYNTVLSVAVLGPLGAASGNSARLRRGALLGGLGLGFAAALIFLALAGDFKALSAPEIPMLTAARRLSPAAESAYALVLAAEIYTTSVGALFGFTARLLQAGARVKPLLPATAALAFLAAQLGFSGLVARLYPLVGYGGLLLLAGLLFRFHGRRARCKARL